MWLFNRSSNARLTSVSCPVLLCVASKPLIALPGFISDDEQTAKIYCDGQTQSWASEEILIILLGEVCDWGEAFHMLHLTTNEAATQTWGRKSWQRSSTPLAFSRTAEAGNNLTIIKGYKPCHAAIRPNSWQPISYDINGRNHPQPYNSALL